MPQRSSQPKWPSSDSITPVAIDDNSSGKSVEDDTSPRLPNGRIEDYSTADVILPQGPAKNSWTEDACSRTPSRTGRGSRTSTQSVHWAHARTMSQVDEVVQTPAAGCRAKSTTREGANIDGLRPDDLGIAFCTRAEFCEVSKADPARVTKRLQLRGLTKVLPEVMESREMRVSFKTGACFNMLERWRRAFKFPISSTSRYARRTARFLTSSAIISCFYVPWVLSTEPMCDSLKFGPLPPVQAWLAYFHLVNAVLYPLVALPSKAIFTRVDLARGEELNAPYDIFMSHLRSPSLYLDMLVVIGLAAEIARLFEARNSSGVPSLFQWAMLLQMCKGWRVIFPEHLPGVKRETFFMSIMWLLLTLVFFSLVMASFLLVLGAYEESWGLRSWTDENGILTGDCVERSIQAFYFAVIGLTSVGYGDSLVTPLEFAVNSLFLLLAQLFAAKVCADLTWHTSTHNQWAARHQASRVEMWIALQRMQVPQVLATRVLAFQNYVAMVHREDLAQPAFAGLSDNLMTELRLCTYRKLLLQASFLREQPKDVIALIVSTLYDSVYLPADFIMRVGDKGREFYFVRRGECAVFVGGEVPCWGRSEEVAVYKTGHYFGETAMLTGRPRAAWIMAKTYCICSVLPHSAVQTLGRDYPGAFTTLVQTMVADLKMTASVSWEQVGRRLQQKYSFRDITDAYAWFVNQNGYDDEDLLATGFESGLAKLKVPELDRKIMWAEMDTDNSGYVSLEEFAEKFDFTDITSRASLMEKFDSATSPANASLR